MSDAAAARQRAIDAVGDISDDLIRISRDIHAHPELAWQERHACSLLVPFLEAQGFRMQHPAYGIETAFRGEWGSGPVAIAICAEYDALPEIGHACGHNLIATAGVGAAVAIIRSIEPSAARVIVLGTPAEEGSGGKIRMINAGCFEDIDVALMAHPGPVHIDASPMFGVAHVDVEYRGKAVHASVFPEQGINALDGLVTAYQAIAQLRQHMRRDARIHGIITNGGEAPNIVPGKAEGKFYVRALKPWYLEQLKDRVRKCFEAGALAAGCELSMDWHEDEEYAPMRNNGPLAAAYRANAESLGVQFYEMRELTAGSTDMGNVSQVVPSIHPSFGVGSPTLTHSPEFTAVAATDAAHDAMLTAARALAMTGVDVALDADLLQRARDEFNSGRGSR